AETARESGDRTADPGGDDAASVHTHVYAHPIISVLVGTSNLPHATIGCVDAAKGTDDSNSDTIRRPDSSLREPESAPFDYGTHALPEG
ncbi:hypothetical protein, partial [Halorubrum sp. SS7]|uniref:hypothetical protein n=1 Tax=Halorubrum sp. SS7 TaxID=2518119 RepID=UPI001A7E16D5